MTSDPPHTAPQWSWTGLALGARLALPAMPGMIAFAIAVGATSARKGFTLVDTILMNGLVYAGASQMVAMDLWPERISFAAVVSLALVTATINARMLLMGATLQPWLGALPVWQVYPMLHTITDPGWLIAMRYRAQGGNDAAIVLGGGLFIWALWLIFTSCGYLLGALVSDPRKIGLDLVMPIFFAAMLIPLWRGRRRAIGWLVAGGVALAVEHVMHGWWFIVAGALAGALVEGFSDER